MIIVYCAIIVIISHMVRNLLLTYRMLLLLLSRLFRNEMFWGSTLTMWMTCILIWLNYLLLLVSQEWGWTRCFLPKLDAWSLSKDRSLLYGCKLVAILLLLLIYLLILWNNRHLRLCIICRIIFENIVIFLGLLRTMDWSTLIKLLLVCHAITIVNCNLLELLLL